MFLVCGEALFDLFLVSDNGPAQLTFDARAGGSPFNVAIGLARQGAAAALMTGVSGDMLGRRLAQALANEGVETRYLVRSERQTTLSIVDLRDQSAPAYAFYGQGSADCGLTVSDLPAVGDEIKAIHFGSYSIAASPVADAFAALARAQSGRFMSLDPNVRPTVLADRAIWRDRIDQLLPSVDLVKASAEDIDWLFPGAAVEEIALRWLKRGPNAVVVTNGAEAVSAFRGNDRIDVVPPIVEVVDTVGAGDAFQAALLAQLSHLEVLTGDFGALSADRFRGALVHASNVAATTCTRRGAETPRLAEVGS